MWIAAIKTADTKNSEAANKSHHNSDKRLFSLKICHACGSSHRTAAHLPHFSSHWHLLTARPCPFLISFKETSICHFFISHSPQGRWVFLNREELVRVIFLPAKQQRKKPDVRPPQPCGFPFSNTIGLNIGTLWSIVSLMFSPIEESRPFALLSWIRNASLLFLFKYIDVAKMPYFRGFRCFVLLLNCFLFWNNKKWWPDPEINSTEQICGELDIKSNRSTIHCPQLAWENNREKKCCKR